MAQPLADLLQAALLMTAGAGCLVFPGRQRRRAERQYSDRLAQLEAGGAESFFEEKRSLRAFPPAGCDRSWRLLGALLLLIAGVRIYSVLAQ